MFRICLFLTTLLVTAPLCRGQSSAVTVTRPGGSVSQNGGFTSSTLAGSVGRGFAAVIDAQAHAVLANAAAASQFEDARSKYLRNQIEALLTRQEQIRISRATRQLRNRRHPRVRQSDESSYEMTHLRRRGWLTSSELDPLTGEVSWPTLLQEPTYREQTTQLQELYAERARIGHLSLSQMGRVEQLTNSLQRRIDDEREVVGLSQWSKSRRFLQKLASDAKREVV